MQHSAQPWEIGPNPTNQIRREGQQKRCNMESSPEEKPTNANFVIKVNVVIKVLIPYST